jgi:Mn2+/Fe2+ NRAMP family transporter
LSLGKFNALDKLIKYLIIALSLSTILSFFLAGIEFGEPIKFQQVFPIKNTEVIFLIAFMGWMPAPLDVSIWNSLWTVEKRKEQQNPIKNSIFDFNLGYFGTAVLGICFIGIGYFTIYNSTETLSNSASIFSNQLINLYTSSLGDWSYYLIAIAAFSTMLSTTVTAFDASPRAMAVTTELIFDKKIKHIYIIWLLILCFGTITIFFIFSSQMGMLIKIATILSFLTAPFYAITNYILISSNKTPKEFRPSKLMHLLSVLGIIYLVGFSVFFLIKGI